MQTTTFENLDEHVRPPASARWRAYLWLRWMGNPFGYAIGTLSLSALGLVTSLAIPRFLAPDQFGSYALLLDLCRYAMRADLGLTQLADRRIAGCLDQARADEAECILSARWRMGLVALVVFVPLASLAAALSRTLSPLDTALATSAGIVAMVAGGPSSIYRARGDIWMYTALTFMFGVGFFIPRLVGIVIGGTTGCFTLLLFWYSAVAAAFWRTSRRGAGRDVAAFAMVRTAMPMFGFAASWTLYLSAARWVAAALTTPSELGLFALGANLVFTGVTTVGILADVRYPTWLGRLSRSGECELSGSLVREALSVAVPLAMAVAILVPAAPRLVALLFPGYLGAERPLVALACAGVPLGVFAWFLPIVVARSANPTRDAAIVFGPSSAVLLVATAAGEHLSGLQGLAWGSCASAVTALAGMAVVLKKERILAPRAALAFMLLPSLCLSLPATALLLTKQLGNSRIAISEKVQKRKAVFTEFHA